MIRAWTSIACIAFVFQGSFLAAEERLRDFHILGVGINDFLSKNAPPLHRPAADVYQMADFFSKQDFDSGKPKRAPRLIPSEKATKQEVERELADLPNWVADRGTLVLLMSSHGVREGGNWYFVTRDTEIDNLEGTSVPGKTIVHAVDNLIAKKKCRVLMVLDACHAGQILTAAEPLFDKYRDPAQGGFILLASCVPNQLAVERASGGIFYTSLMQGLQFMMAHVHPTGSVSVKEIRQYLRAALQSQMRFTFWKVPGVEWKEQYSLVECSTSIPEDLGLVWADPKTTVPVNANLTMDANSRPQNMKVVATDASPVGLWLCSRPLITKFKGASKEPAEYLRDEKGELVVEKILLNLDKDGNYEVLFVNLLGKPERGTGKFRFKPGVEFALVYDTGIDYFSMEKLSADEMILVNPALAVIPSPSVLDQIGQSTARLDPVFKFVRVKQDEKK